MHFDFRVSVLAGLLVPLASFGFIDSKVEFFPEPGGNYTAKIRFLSEENQVYELLQSDNLSDWQRVGETLVGSGNEELFKTTTFPTGQFFQVSESDTYLSETTGTEYPYRVYVPPGYHLGSKSYPVIYATDGQWLFDEFREAIVEQGKEVILVGIDEGPEERRLVDYTSPGSTDYYQFLITEFLPFFESHGRVDPGERTICGTSVGGLFVGLVLLMDDVEAPSFKNYLSFDGSFWWDRSFLDQLEQTRFEASSSLNATLFLSSALGASNNDGVVSQFESQLAARNFSGLTIIRRSYDVDHGDVAGPSFREALELLF